MEPATQLSKWVGREQYWTSQGNVRRGIVVWWKTGLDVVPLPDNCFNFLYGFKAKVTT
jgi:hypothetical protein